MIEENNLNNTTEEIVPTVEETTPENTDVQGVDFIPGPDDIVIEEDFDIDIDVKPVSTANISVPTENVVTTNDVQPQTQTLGTEQSGNITF